MYLVSTENFYIANFAVPEIASLAITTLFQICAFLVFLGQDLRTTQNKLFDKSKHGEKNYHLSD